LHVVREALADVPAWLVGGAVRDELRGVERLDDVDLVVDGEVRAAARALAKATGGVAFELSDEFGAWRVLPRDRSWQADLNPLRGDSLEEDLALRDFTVNAIAQPLAGGELIDPFGGARDLERGVLRVVAPSALDDDPLRALRLVRLACEQQLAPDDEARSRARAAAPGLAGVAAERVFAELKRILASERAAEGMRLADELGLTAAVLPELDALAGVEQNKFHHLDVRDHTLAVLQATVELQRDPGAVLGDEHAAAITARLAEPLADELTRGVALRFGALLHDVAKPQTRGVTAEGRVIFPGHDQRGAAMVREILRRLRASERLASHVAALTLHHLRLGFLVHHQPLSRRDVYRYLDTCDAVAADVTLLSVADRLATRGARAEESIERHINLARELIGEALQWHRAGRAAPLVRGDQLSRALGVEPGPRVGELLAKLAEAQFAGEIATREQAIEYARELIA
jgi:putative nucleotidyltransferase with HDIG domain